MQDILNRVEEKKNKQLLTDAMPLYASAMLWKNYGYKLYKHTYGRKEKGIYIYPKNDKEKVFLSLNTFKDGYTNEEMEEIFIELVKDIA